MVVYSAGNYVRHASRQLAVRRLVARLVRRVLAHGHLPPSAWRTSSSRHQGGPGLLAAPPGGRDLGDGEEGMHMSRAEQLNGTLYSLGVKRYLTCVCWGVSQL